jgi:hypothetical protein
VHGRRALHPSECSSLKRREWPFDGVLECHGDAFACQFEERRGSREGLLFPLPNRGPKEDGDREVKVHSLELKPGGYLVVYARFLPSPSLNGQLRER